MSFLSRYQNGECEQIWAEMLALGESVQEEPWYSDAMAVARETMRCARQNIELQIDRLNSLGYRFGYDWWDAEYREMLEDNPPPPVFAAPRPDVLNQLAQVEAQVGMVPLSLRAWYEQIGAVNFVGMYPVADPTDPNGFTCYEQFVESGARSKGGSSLWMSVFTTSTRSSSIR